MKKFQLYTFWPKIYFNLVFNFFFFLNCKTPAGLLDKKLIKFKIKKKKLCFALRKLTKIVEENSYIISTLIVNYWINVYFKGELYCNKKLKVI